jgi:hypothetical protein
VNFSHRNTRLALPVLLGLLALAGCGGSTKTVTVGGPPSGVTGSSASGATTSGTTTATPTGPVVHLSAFRSPTGNIGCMLTDGQARCDIARRSWSPPARPASCPTVVDFGQGLEMAATGAPRFVCAGDTVREPKSPVLAYGTSSISGPFECISASSGMTCTRPDGHGFFLSIQTYRLF